MQPLQGVPRGLVLTAPRGLKGDNARSVTCFLIPTGHRGKGRHPPTWPRSGRPGGGRHHVGVLLLLEQASRISWLIAIHTRHLAV